MKEPMEVSAEQLNLFRELRIYDVNEDCPCENNWFHVYDMVEEQEPGKIINNFRPPIDREVELREVGGH